MREGQPLRLPGVGNCGLCSLRGGFLDLAAVGLVAPCGGVEWIPVFDTVGVVFRRAVGGGGRRYLGVYEKRMGGWRSKGPE